MRYKFNDVPQNLSYGQKREISVEPTRESAAAQLWKSDDIETKKEMLNMDVAIPKSGKNTMQFKIPPKGAQTGKEIPAGRYILAVNATKQGGREREQNSD